MKCPNCNNDVKDEMKFCPKCGSKVPQVRICPDCGAEVKEGMEFCSKCGKHINVQRSNSTVSNPTRVPPPPTDQESSLAIEFEREIEQEKRKSMIKWGCIVAAFILGGIIWYDYNSSENLSSGYSTSSPSSSYTPSNETQLYAELEEAENELDMASKSLNEVLPLCLNIVLQYGGGYNGSIIAHQNNPTLFSQFDAAEARYEKGFEKIISIYEKMGRPESANAYRTQLQEWRKKIRKNIMGSPY